MRGETSVESIVWDARLASPESAGPGPIAPDVAERRLSALAAAVREHEGRVRAQIGGPRPHDRVLHARLRQILGATDGDRKPLISRR
jgi:hypothetical protein